MLANFFQVSLNTVLWSFRFLVIAVPVVVGIVTYRICKELAAIPVSDEPKRSAIISRTEEGEYVMQEADIRPGDRSEDLEPIAVPARIGPSVKDAGMGREKWMEWNWTEVPLWAICWMECRERGASRGDRSGRADSSGRRRRDALLACSCRVSCRNDRTRDKIYALDYIERSC